MQKTPDFWQQPTCTAKLLWPLSLLYLLGRKAHRQIRLGQCYWPAVPTISVGNLSAGGAGKTPLVLALAEHYAAQGEQVAILSRGYKSKENRWPTLVSADMDVPLAGDEPLMLARKLQGTTAQVWIGKNRKAVAKRAEQAGATLLILDDGFQRDDVARTVDIVVLDGQVGFGNGYCLPAGPLRETPAALARADFVVIFNSKEALPLYLDTRSYRLSTRLAQKDVAKLRDKPLVAFAGLARPEKFFNSLQREGLNITAAEPFADHYNYTNADLKDLQEQAKANKAVLVTTEKDAARLPLDSGITAVSLEITGMDWDNILAEIEERCR